MAKPKKAEVALIEFDRNQAVLDTPLGRLVIEPGSVRFHKNGRGRGVTLVEG
jgi:hypothetical protein